MFPNEISKLIHDKIHSIKNKKDIGTYEYEIRFRFDNDNGILKQDWLRTLDFFKNGFDCNQTESVDQYYNINSGTFRKTTCNNVTSYMIKSRELIHYIGEYRLTYNISKEQRIEEDQYNSNHPQIQTRYKKRTRIVFNEYYLDFTIVNNDTYELELENISLTLPELEIKIKNILMIIFNTKIYYNSIERGSVISEFNAKCMKNSIIEENGKLNYQTLSQARVLKPNDCVYGGLIKGNTKYSITPKAGGFRTQLFFNNVGLWIISFGNAESMDNISLLKRYKYNEKLHICIDGENIPYDKRLNSEIKTEYLYLPFDIMNNNEINNHFERLKKLREIFEKIQEKQKIKHITFMIKEFIPIGDDEESLLKAYKQVKSLKLPYATDGFVFTPINQEYLLCKQTKFDKRELSNSPDICKLKPWNELTIDFMYKLGNLYTGDSLFEGTQWLKFDKTMIINEIPDSEDKIIEFAPVVHNDYIMLKAVRIRHDKKYPNKKDIAEDIWNNISKPLLPETFEGKTITLLRKFHNNIKRQIYDLIPNDADIIDIGCGQGGDIDKQKKFRKILGIEPSEEFIKTYNDRLNRSGVNINKFRIIKGYGQNTDLIIKNAKEFFGWGLHSNNHHVHIVMMISLSFFYESYDLLSQLANTLNQISTYTETFFHFMTIEGNAVKKLFINTNTIDLASIHMELTGNKMFININEKGTTVSNQDEYLVDLEALERMLNTTDFKYSQIDSRGTMLFPDERIYNNVFVEGSCTLNYKNIEIEQYGISDLILESDGSVHKNNTIIKYTPYLCIKDLDNTKRSLTKCFKLINNRIVYTNTTSFIQEIIQEYKINIIICEMEGSTLIIKNTYGSSNEFIYVLKHTNMVSNEIIYESLSV
jgi:hypothetical protein